MAVRYVEIGQYPDVRREVRGKLSEILTAPTPNPGTYAAPEDVTGCFLEMGTDGKWYGASVGSFGSFEELNAVPTIYLATGSTAMIAGVSKTYQGASVGWVDVPGKAANLLNMLIARFNPANVGATYSAGDCTFTRDSNNPDMSGRRILAPKDPFSYFSGLVADHPLYSGYGFAYSPHNRNATGSLMAGQWGASVRTNATSIFINLCPNANGVNSTYSVFVDGKFLASGTAISTFPERAKLAFSSTKMRTVSVVTSSCGFLKQFLWDTNASANFEKIKSPIVAVLGDSYVDGYFLTNPELNFTTYLLQAFGIFSAASFGIPGTGFTNAYSGAGTYAQRIQWLSAINPDIIIVLGGLNDGAATPSQESSAVQSFVSSLKTQFPQSLAVIVGTKYSPGQSISQSIYDAIASGVSLAGGNFIDLQDSITLTGNGYIGADNVHYNSTGSPYLGEYIAQGICAL